MSNSIISQIPCDWGRTYIGQTKVGIKNCMKQHYISITAEKRWKFSNDKTLSRYEISMLIWRWWSFYYRRRKRLLVKKN